MTPGLELIAFPLLCTTSDFMNKLATRSLLMLLFLAASVGIDQWSKLYAVANWKEQPPKIFLADTFRIQYAENPGGFLSLGANLKQPFRTVVFVVINGGILAVAGGWMIYSIRFSGPWTWWAVGMIVSGGIGNLIDRVRLEGRVIDFMNMGIGNLRTGIFNVADIAISTGVVILVIVNFSTSSQKNDEDDKTEHDSKPSEINEAA